MAGEAAGFEIQDVFGEPSACGRGAGAGGIQTWSKTSGCKTLESRGEPLLCRQAAEDRHRSHRSPGVAVDSHHS